MAMQTMGVEGMLEALFNEMKRNGDSNGFDWSGSNVVFRGSAQAVDSFMLWTDTHVYSLVGSALISLPRNPSPEVVGRMLQA